MNNPTLYVYIISVAALAIAFWFAAREVQKLAKERAELRELIYQLRRENKEAFRNGVAVGMRAKTRLLDVYNGEPGILKEQAS